VYNAGLCALTEFRARETAKTVGEEGTT
jgi:hypothetical protein